MLFSGTADATPRQCLDAPPVVWELRPNSTLDLRQMPLFKKKDLAAIARENGHPPLPRLPIVQDFNPIERDFANLKKRRQFAPLNTPLADIIKSYGK